MVRMMPDRRGDAATPAAPPGSEGYVRRAEAAPEVVGLVLMGSRGFDALVGDDSSRRPTQMPVTRAGDELDAGVLADVSALCRQFGIPLLDESVALLESATGTPDE